MYLTYSEMSVSKRSSLNALVYKAIFTNKHLQISGIQLSKGENPVLMNVSLRSYISWNDYLDFRDFQTKLIFRSIFPPPDNPLDETANEHRSRCIESAVNDCIQSMIDDGRIRLDTSVFATSMEFADAIRYECHDGVSEFDHHDNRNFVKFSSVFCNARSAAQRRLHMFREMICKRSGLKLHARDKSILYRLMIRLGDLNDAIYMHDLDDESLKAFQDHGYRNFALFPKTRIDNDGDGYSMEFFMVDDGRDITVVRGTIRGSLRDMAMGHKLRVHEWEEIPHNERHSFLIKRRMPLTLKNRRISAEYDRSLTSLVGISLNRKFLSLFMKRAVNNLRTFRACQYFRMATNPDVIRTILKTITMPDGVDTEIMINYLSDREHGAYRRQAMLAMPCVISEAVSRQNEAFITSENACVRKSTSDRFLTDIDNGRPITQYLRDCGYSKKVMNVFFSRSWHVYGAKLFAELTYVHPRILHELIQRQCLDRVNKKNRHMISIAQDIHNLSRFMKQIGNFTDLVKQMQFDVVRGCHDLIMFINQNLCQLDYCCNNGVLTAVLTYDGDRRVPEYNVDGQKYHECHDILAMPYLKAWRNMDHIIPHEPFIEGRDLSPYGENAGLFVYNDIHDLQHASKHYHENIGTIVTETNRAIENAKALKAGMNTEEIKFDFSKWPAIFDDYQDEHGSIHVITQADELTEEGISMDHCVGGYVGQCLQMSSFILQIDTRTDETSTVMSRRSTAEITVDSDDDKHSIRIVQNRSHHNSLPHPDNDSILDRYIKQITLTPDMIVSMKQQKKAYARNHMHGLPYDRHVVLRLSLPFIRGLLPRRYASMPIDRLYAMISREREQSSERHLQIAMANHAVLEKDRSLVLDPEYV